jgi:GntR family transcriptional repressor for pyruvate dehydrogenase complex
MASRQGPRRSSAASDRDGTDLPESLGVLRPARRKGLAEEVADQLIDLIASSSAAEVRLPPERKLCEQFGVSRNPLREALAALDQMGILETRGKARIGLSPRARARQMAKLSTPAGVSPRDLLLDPMETRRILEPETAALAASRATEASVQDMERWLDLMEAAIREGRPVAEYDSGFHVAVAQATVNAILIQLVGALTEALQPSRARSFRPQEAAARALEDHREILAAIRAGDSRAARRTMRAHLDHVEELLRSTITESGEDG